MIETFKDFIITYVGTYTASDYTSLAGADWEFIAGCIILFILVISFFKILRFVFRGFFKL